MKKVKLPRKAKKKFMTLKANGKLFYWIAQRDIMSGKKTKFPSWTKGIPRATHRYIPGVGVRMKPKAEIARIKAIWKSVMDDI